MNPVMTCVRWYYQAWDAFDSWVDRQLNKSTRWWR